MALQSSVFSSIQNLDTYVADTTGTSDQINLVNLNNPGTAVVGDFLINSNAGGYFIETGTDTLVLSAESGSLGTAQTGLSSAWSYTHTQIGYVKLKVGGVIKRFHIKEYHNEVYTQNVVRVFEILDDVTRDLSASLEWINGSPGQAYENDPRIIVAGTSHYFSSPSTIVVDIPDDGGVTFEFKLLITESDLLSAPGNEIAMQAQVRDGLETPLVTSDTTTSARELTGTISLSDVASLVNAQLTVTMQTGSEIIIE